MRSLSSTESPGWMASEISTPPSYDTSQHYEVPTRPLIFACNTKRAENGTFMIHFLSY